MKLMIEINDNEYMGIKEYPNNITSYPVTIHLYDAVRNGIPLEQEPKTDVLDKIRAEIEQIEGNEVEVSDMQGNIYKYETILKTEALQIIDKYKAESEG